MLYLRCDGCDQVTPRTTERKILRVSRTEIIGGTPETVCATCKHPQPRVVDDEVPADTTMVCTGHPLRRIGFKRSRKTCRKTIAVPAAATLVICPWCIIETTDRHARTHPAPPGNPAEPAGDQPPADV